MITFQKIRWKNFLSTGDQFSEIDFQKNATNLIVGTNGTGKSTVLDALTFSLFNKPFRKINKSQLVNATNEKDCVVELDFTIGSTDWFIRRGIKPNIFEIHRNGSMMNQSSAANDQQKWLEQNVVKMNYKSFTQIVILGSSTFVPFMQLSGSNRREVIEDLLDIKIFSAMNNIIRDKIRDKKEKVRTLELKKTSLKEKLEMQQNFMEEVEKRGKERIDSKKEKINSLIVDTEECIASNEWKEDDIQEHIKDQERFTGADKKLKELGNLKGKISNKASTVKKEHKFFSKNTVCPTCTQNIGEELRLNKLDEAQQKAKELQSGYQELEKAIEKEEERERQFIQLTKGITKLTNEISQNNVKISGFQKQIRELESEIQNNNFMGFTYSLSHNTFISIFILQQC